MSIFGNPIKADEQRLQKKEQENFYRAFAEFSDEIFADDDSSDISKYRRELVKSFEDEEFIPLSADCFFKVIKSEDGGLLLSFAESEKAANEKKIFLNKEDSVVFFDEVVAVKEGLFASIGLTDRVNNVDIDIKLTQSQQLSFMISLSNAVVVKLIGTRAILQKIIYYCLYAKYYKR